MTTIKLSFGSKKYKSWVAEITGQDAKYGFSRKFLNTDDRETAEVTLANGVYQINGQGASDFYEKAYIIVKDGEVTEIEKSEVLAAIEAMNEPTEVETAEEIEAEETIEDVKAEGRKLVAEVVAAVDSKKMKEWAHHYTTNIFTYSKNEEQIRTLRDKLKNEKESIIAQFKKAYKL